LLLLLLLLLLLVLLLTVIAVASNGGATHASVVDDNSVAGTITPPSLPPSPSFPSLPPNRQIISGVATKELVDLTTTCAPPPSIPPAGATEATPYVIAAAQEVNDRDSQHVSQLQG
jgi:hypothetical protein